MKTGLLKLICCPVCKSNFELITYSSTKNEVNEGLLVCKRCRKSYVIKRSIPRFIRDDGYVESFSFQWLKHRKTQLDSFNGTHESEQHFIAKTGFDLEQMKDKLVLDVGCGVGRFMDVALQQDAQVIGIDLSFSIDVARENFKDCKRAHFIQADIFNLPFKEGIFDFIYSIGVLHHTPDPKKAFSLLPRLLKKGGVISIWVYSNDGLYLKLYNFFSDAYRIFTKRMRPRRLYALSKIAVPFYYVKKIPFFGKMFQIIFPTSLHPNKDWRILETYDFYSPQYQFHYTTREVLAWYFENDLRNVHQLHDTVCIRGER